MNLQRCRSKNILFSQHVLQWEKSSAIAHTCNDCEDEGEAEEEERMTAELSPIPSTQTILI